MERIRDKYIAMALHLDERGRRRWAAAEARDLGWGGISAVANATGMSDRTIRSGIREIEDPSPLSPDRQLRPGAGRPPKEIVDCGLVEALKNIVDSATRGVPMSPLRWTSKSTRSIASELQRLGFEVSHVKVAAHWAIISHRVGGWLVGADRSTVAAAGLIPSALQLLASGSLLLAGMYGLACLAFAGSSRRTFELPGYQLEIPARRPTGRSEQAERGMAASQLTGVLALLCAVVAVIVRFGW